MLDLGVEADPLPQPETLRVLAQELPDLGVVGEVRIAIVHREVLKADGVLRRIDVERAVGRGAPVGVPEIPVAADVVGGVETGVGDLPVAERLDGGQAAGAGADHAGVGKLSHGGVTGGRPVSSVTGLLGSTRIFACPSGCAKASNAPATPSSPTVPVISGRGSTLPSASMCRVSRNSSGE